MQHRGLLFSALVGAVASARSMMPMATIAAARLLGQRTPGRLVLLDRKRAMVRIGQTRSGLIEDALVVAVGVALVALAVKPKDL